MISVLNAKWVLPITGIHMGFGQQRPFNVLFGCFPVANQIGGEVYFFFSALSSPVVACKFIFPCQIDFLVP